MVRQGALALAMLASLPLLAGCLETPAPPAPLFPTSPFLLHAGEVQAEGFYAFDHAGGSLAFRLASSASAKLELFDGDDHRVGEYGLGRNLASSDLRLDDLAAGTYVVRIAALDGTLGIDSAGQEAALTPLSGHVERVLLANRPHNPVPPVPFFPLDTLHQPLRLQLTRVPTGVRLLTDGTFGWLNLTLDGAGGEVFRSEMQGGGLASPFYDSMYEIPGAFHSERSQDGQLVGALDAEDLQGSLILEAVSYSRAAPPGQDLIGTQARHPAFVYGLLPPLPVVFQVAQGTNQLVLWNDLPSLGESAAPAWVALFDPQDHKVASVPVYSGTFTTVHVDASGPFVAVLLSGNATLGADVAPIDFGLKPLNVLTTDVPQQPAGSNGDYGQANETTEQDGTLFDVRMTSLNDRVDFPVPVVTCGLDESIRILQDDEMAAAWGPQWSIPDLPTGVLLASGDVTLWHDGFGFTGCRRTGAQLLSYQRA